MMFSYVRRNICFDNRCIYLNTIGYPCVRFMVIANYCASNGFFFLETNETEFHFKGVNTYLRATVALAGSRRTQANKTYKHKSG